MTVLTGTCLSWVGWRDGTGACQSRSQSCPVLGDLCRCSGPCSQRACPWFHVLLSRSRISL